MSAAGRRGLGWLLLAGAVVLSAGLGLRDPWPPDEPRFALIAKDMVESGDWLIPRVGGVLYPDKPPLFFWLVAGFYSLTGSISVALLLPALLAGVGVLWLVYDLARRLWGPETGLWSGAALLATIQFPLQMKAGQIDGLLCFWTTLGLYGLARHLLLGPDWRWLALAGAACGLGVITKGVGFLPLLALLPWLYARVRGWPLPRPAPGRGRWLLLPSAFLLAIGAWLLPMLIVTSGSGDPDLFQYRDNILLKQTVTRYADAWGHIKPPWYLLTNAVSWLWLPLTLLLPWLVPAWIRDLRAKQAATLVFVGWMLLVLLFFSLSDGKRSVYVFPALPALVLAAGPHLPRLFARTGVRRAVFALALLLASLAFVAGLYGLAEPSMIERALPGPSADALARVLIVIGLAALAAAAACRARRAALGYAATLAVLWLGLSLLVYPLIDAARSGRAIIDAAEQALAPGESLAFAGWKEQLLLQWNRPAVHFGYRRNDDAAEVRDAAAWLVLHPDHRLLLPQRMAESCFERSRAIALGRAHRKEWLLASVDAVLPACRGDADAAEVNAVLYEPSRPYDTRVDTPADAPGAPRHATPSGSQLSSSMTMERSALPSPTEL
jgi:4-amino-4-deoxy-L-arabinose transferase-like glycosyltransferase